MLIWIQVIIFIISNAPALYRAVKELISLFRKDKKKANEVLEELKQAKNRPNVSTADLLKQYNDIIEKHKHTT